MAELLQGSVFLRVLRAIIAFFCRMAADSTVFRAVGRCWRSSRTHSWLFRRLGADDRFVQNAKTTALFSRLNAALGRCKAPVRCWEDSLPGRVWHAVVHCGKNSRLLSWLFSDGMNGILLVLIGLYVGIDWFLRDVLPIPALGSVWDEALMLFCVLWIVWQRFDRKTPIAAKANPLDLPVLIFIAVSAVLMCVVSPYPNIQFTGFRATVQYLLWFFLITRLLQSDEDFMRLYLAMLALAVVISLHGIYQYITRAPMPAKWVAAAETAVRTRVYSIFGSPNIMGDYMVMFVPMTVALAYHTKKKSLQLAAWLAAIVMCVACLFTMSRGAWVAMAVTIVLFILLVDKRLFLVLLAGICVLVLIPFVRTRIGFLFTDDFVAANTNGGRAGRWALGLEHLASADPLTGFGFGMFGGAVAMQNQVLDHVEYFYMDNYYLKILVETGWLGLGSFILMLLGMIVCACRSLFRTAKDRREERPMYPLTAGMFSGLVGVLVHCYFENIFEEPYMMVCFWVIAAMIVYTGFLRKSYKNIENTLEAQK